MICCVVFFGSFKSISTQLDTILPSSDEKELLQTFNTLQSSKKIFLSVKGNSQESLNTIKDLEQKLLKIEGVSLEKFKANVNLQQYKNDYAFYIHDFKEKSFAHLDIDKHLSLLKSNILTSDFSYFIDKNDPFNLLQKEIDEKNTVFKNGHLFIKEYGYFSVFNLDNALNSLEQYEGVYDAIHAVIPSTEAIKVFSPIFYFVENSRIIKNDVNTIILYSMVVLFLLYWGILRNIKLLIYTLITLGSSALLALLTLSFLFDKISVFAVVFGVSISTVAIDYMFHHYVHDHYRTKKDFNKEVFFGMITSVGAFFIISFVSFELLKQICYFAMISLLFSYFQFSVLYPKIGFPQATNKDEKVLKFHANIKPISVILFSMVVIAVAFSQIKVDLNLKNLDVDNPSLKALESSFAQSVEQQNNMPFLIQASSIDALIKNARILKKTYPNAHIPLSILLDKETFLKRRDFLEKENLNKINLLLNKKASNYGFKEGYFEQAYTYNKEVPLYTLEKLQQLNLEVFAYKDAFVSHGYLPKDKKETFSQYPFLQSLSIKDMFENKLTSIYKELVFYGVLTILFIVLMILFSSRRNHLISFSYVLFPVAMVLALSFFINFNILHLFMLFVLLSISIDFGIYMGSKNLNHKSYKAILYSLLSTFAGFGVLIFSKINALFSMGIIATVGTVAIAILLIILKRPFNEFKNIQ